MQVGRDRKVFGSQICCVFPGIPSLGGTGHPSPAYLAYSHVTQSLVSAPQTEDSSPNCRTPPKAASPAWHFSFFLESFLILLLGGNSKGHIGGIVGLVYFQIIGRQVLSEKSRHFIGLQSNSIRIKDCKSLGLIWWQNGSTQVRSG